jgi:hypothetical protein
VAGVREQGERTGPPPAHGLHDSEREGQERGAMQGRRVAAVVVMMVVMVMVRVLSHGR